MLDPGSGSSPGGDDEGQKRPGAQTGTCPGNWVTPLTANDQTMPTMAAMVAAKLFVFTQEPQNVKMSLEGKINM